MFPPLTVTGAKPAAGPGLDASKLGTHKRPDGLVQVTYNGFALYRYEYDTEWGLMMAMSVCVTLPIIILFFFVQRTFIQGITLTGIKG